jgi:hypothetical protein
MKITNKFDGKSGHMAKIAPFVGQGNRDYVKRCPNAYNQGNRTVIAGGLFLSFRHCYRYQRFENGFQRSRYPASRPLAWWAWKLEETVDQFVIRDSIGKSPSITKFMSC